MPMDRKSKRSLIAFGFIAAVIVAAAAAVIGIANEPYRHDRRAMRAFFEWKANPTGDNEGRWRQARDQAMARNIRFKVICFGLAALSGLTAWHLRRRLAESRAEVT